ncbi:MAG: cytochrome c [Magnetococcales bacterium]|nr:cytochrome c [Magnetococcales bacterium]
MKTALMLSVLGLLLVSATPAISADKHQTPNAPAEFQSKKNPIEFDELDEKAVKSVERLYGGKCKKCHGEEGGGDGTAAADMLIKPTAFNAPGYAAKRSDGQLFWITLNGSPNTEMKGFGPGTDNNLSEQEIWKLVAFIKNRFAK